jgi:hypothetical protein
VSSEASAFKLTTEDCPFMEVCGSSKMFYDAIDYNKSVVFMSIEK